MSPINRDTLEKKLSQMLERIQHLKAYQKDGFEYYQEHFERRKATEKVLQELIECAIDVNMHILVESGFEAPEDYTQSFLSLPKSNWISKDLALKLAPSAGLRNRLVHGYSQIDDQKVFESINLAIRHFGDYVIAIEEKLAES